MKKSTWILTGLALVAFLGIGFWLGQSVDAQTNQPGSAADPLVSRSYVDEKITALENQVAALTARIEALERGTGTGGQSGTTPGSGTSTPSSQIVYPKKGNTYVNLRSGPGTNHSVVTKVYAGTAMTVLGTTGQWYSVRLPNNQTGYVANWVVSTTK